MGRTFKDTRKPKPPRR